MFAFVTNASERVVAQLVSALDVTAFVRPVSRSVDAGLTVVEVVRSQSAPPLVAMLRRGGYYIDRLAMPSPRGGTRSARIGWVDLPVARVQPVVAGVASHVVGRDVSPEMDALMRRVSRR